MTIRSANINVMVAAARKAARGILRDFGEVEQLQVSRKGTNDFVTAADTRTEKVLRQELKKARPDYGFLLEEGGEEVGSNASNRWIIDPIDGTTNFIHGIPHFAMSIALEREGEIIAGVVYNPITDDVFVAEKGNGAFLNDHRLRVSARRKIEEAVVTTGIPHLGRGDHQQFLRELSAVMGSTAGLRRFGSASLDLAYVAAGRCDAYWERGLQPWDIAAGILLVREAGGYVYEPDGKGLNMMESGNVLATNAHLLTPMSKLLNGQ
ncbi:inositol monophosphatase family protein [Telmatospirillum sp. J64-1]|uniref:inositol monophosphatase family protein n=1 Tax=Telmatospirillum sp. J64-1 TaxID=2502183 RepID=UPI00115F15EA|nr:inositol monophosphatase family protein [Telmatospirillum sp. J64-1]